jgi:hypothetical protein
MPAAVETVANPFVKAIHTSFPALKSNTTWKASVAI